MILNLISFSVLNSFEDHGIPESINSSSRHILFYKIEKIYNTKKKKIEKKVSENIFNTQVYIIRIKAIIPCQS